jgi:hypothetical protein
LICIPGANIPGHLNLENALCCFAGFGPPEHHRMRLLRATVHDEGRVPGMAQPAQPHRPAAGHGRSGALPTQPARQVLRAATPVTAAEHTVRERKM